MADYAGEQIVGIDLHLRRSMLVRQAGEDGRRLGWERFYNDPDSWAKQLRACGQRPKVVVEATYNWYWLADLLGPSTDLHLAHPLGVKGFKNRRVKNDLADASDLADLLRAGLLPEAWIAPGPVREQRELVRYRVKLVHIQTSLKQQVHAVLAKEGVWIDETDLFGAAGRKALAGTRLHGAYQVRVDSLLELIDEVAAHEQRIATLIHQGLREDRGYQAIQAIPGVGPVLAAVFVAEIGDVHRFPDPQHLCSWAGLTPRHYESDAKVRRGHVSKQGSRLLRWAAVEAIQRGGPDWLRAAKDRIEARRGKSIAKTAAARELLTLVFYGLRDGHIRALSARAA
jgi:transposase